MENISEQEVPLRSNITLTCYTVAKIDRIAMPTPNAKRQAAYRARRKSDDSAPTERLNLVIDLHAKRALERLAMCYGVTQKAMVQRLLIAAEHAAVEAAIAFPNGQTDYYDGKLRLRHPD